MSLKKSLILAGALLVLAAVLVACGPAETPAPTTEATEVPAAPLVVPFESVWAASGHADSTAEAFIHWDGDDPKVVPANCARCHTSTGIVDYLNGAPVDVAVPGGVITCTTCHNDTVNALTSVTFPSGAVVTGLGPEARCMTCHQGRESKVSIDAAVTDMEADTVNADLGFKNVHYFSAGATLYGAQAHGGYEYDGQLYDMKFAHTEGLDTCLGCHDQHSLQVKVETCAQCHEGVATVEDLMNARMQGSEEDYDGDGNVTEGIYYEIQGLQEKLYAGIQAYATNNAGAAIVYDANTYPYFIGDADGNGAVTEGEGKYTSWTPRLLKAAYNYNYSIKDPGAFAHNAKYIIELLTDSINDLNTVLTTPVDMTGTQRIDAGHFAGSTMPFRDWDDTGMVPAGCSKCHSATGLPQFIANGGTHVVSGTTLYTTGIVSNPSANGFMCSTCHDEANWPARYTVASVTFPSGKVVSFGGKDADGKWVADDNNICIMCHQGRQSTKVMNAKIGTTEANTVDSKMTFANIHYFAAGATLFGNDVQGAYQFTGKEYLGRNLHGGTAERALGPSTCTACHETHGAAIKTDTCAACHAGVTDPENIRMSTVDYDGDGDVNEGISGEITTLQEALIAQIQAYATANSKPIVYSTENPYWFVDDNANGIADEGETTRYDGFTPNLLGAAYNYHYSIKDPGAFSHNAKYIIQILIDSIEAVGGDITNYTRP